jgi:flagellar biosynthesis protein FlhB
MAEDSDLERSYPATQRRIEQAREQGQVARSRELTAAAVALVAAIGTWSLGPAFAQRCVRLVEQGLILDRAAAFNESRMLSGLGDSATSMLVAVAPLLAIILVATLVAPLILSGWVFSGKALTPDFARLDPLKGLKNIVSKHALAELVKALAKSALLALVGGFAIYHLWGEMQSLVRLDIGTGIAQVGALVIAGMFLLVGALVVIAAVDVPYQLWRYYDGLKMTREELRQELKEQEGDPQLKARIRSLQRQAARKRMMAAVPKASVIVTNPTHYAVALDYKDGMRAPRVVAKGMDLVAQKIRELGEAHGVPVLQAPPLARALHRHADVGDEIPQALYGVVAQVLAYVYQVQRWKQAGGAMPTVPDDLDVPAELDPQAKRAVEAAALAGGAGA